MHYFNENNLLTNRVSYNFFTDHYGLWISIISSSNLVQTFAFSKVNVANFND